jgi:hypothetical protein
MASFKLLPEYRPELYYNKYKYKVVFKIPNIGRVRHGKTSEEVLSNIHALTLRGLVHISPSCQFEDTVKNYFLWKSKTNLNELAIRMNFNSLAISSNNLSLLEDAAKYFSTHDTVYKQAIVNIPQGVKLFKQDPPTKFRVYLKSVKITNESFELILDFITRYKDSSSKFYPNRGLKYWLELYTKYPKKHHWTAHTYSIGYDNESDYLLLALAIPEVLGANFKLEKMTLQDELLHD